MKNNIGIWIDGSEAILINLNSDTDLITKISSDIDTSQEYNYESDKGSFMGTQHISNERKFDERKNQQTNTFFNLLVDKIQNFDGVYIIGPGETKTHFKTTLEGNKSLKTELLGIEPAERITDNQLVAKFKTLFSH